MEKLLFIPPDESHEQIVAEYVAEYRATGDPHINGSNGLRKAKSYDRWLESNAQCRAGNPPEGRYPCDQFLVFRESDMRLVGMLNVRHRLINEKAWNFDGHVGYAVRPGERRKGYAAQMLQKAVEMCEERGICRLLLTCDEGNAGSERTIIGGGGVFEDRRVEPDGNWIRRYWIDTKGQKALSVGTRHSHQITVTPEMTAKRMKSGALEVFATPLMIAEMENCCLECVRPALAQGRSTVGTSVHVRHLAATPVGMTVRFECTLVDVDRRRLTFDVRAFDECGLIGEGWHERFDVDAAAFEQKAMSKA